MQGDFYSSFTTMLKNTRYVCRYFQIHSRNKHKVLRNDITYGKLVYGIDVCKFSKQLVVSMKATRREYGEPKV